MQQIKQILSILLIGISLAFSVSTELQTKIILNDKVSIKIPSDFIELSVKAIRQKYPADSRPSLAFGNENGGNVAFNLTNTPMHQDSIQNYTQNFVEMLKATYPTARWKDQGHKNINGKNVGFVEVVTPGLASEIYNLMFFTEVDDQLLLCSFNCAKTEEKEWSITAHEIMNSLKVK
jgi:hypothetical protein